jgi:hypothetical protein
MKRVNLRRLPDEWGAEEEALLQAVDDATATPIYIEYRLDPEWFDGIADVIDDVEACVRTRPVVALALIEHMILRLDRAGVDDSDGGLVETFERLEPLHAAAASGEDPVALAERLVELAHALDIDPFSRAASTHRKELGVAGLLAIIAAAEARRTGDITDALLEHLIRDAQAALQEDH